MARWRRLRIHCAEMVLGWRVSEMSRRCESCRVVHLCPGNDVLSIFSSSNHYSCLSCCSAFSPHLTPPQEARLLPTITTHEHLGSTLPQSLHPQPNRANTRSTQACHHSLPPHPIPSHLLSSRSTQPVHHPQRRLSKCSVYPYPTLPVPPLLPCFS